MNWFILLLIIILVVIYFYSVKLEKFTSGFDPDFLYSEPVDYKTKKQDCNELTFNPTECVVNTVTPSNEVVCTNTLSPITNNEIDCIKSKSEKKNVEKNPTLSLIYDFDLLSSFNKAQIDNDNEISKKNQNDELETFNDLKTDVKSLNSLENDIMSNY